MILDEVGRLTTYTGFETSTTATTTRFLRI